MRLASILDQYHDAFLAKYGSKLLPGHLRAIDAIRRCRTPEAGEFLLQCGNRVPAGTVAAHNVRTMKLPSGWIDNKPNCYPLSTS